MNPDAALTYTLAALAGKTLRPYQLRASDLLSTPNLAGTGYAAPSVVWLWPRQTGKTTTLFYSLLGRMWHRADYWCAYTAQTGHTVSERFSDPGGWIDQVTDSPLARRHAASRSQGLERIRNTRTRSYVKAFPPKPGKLRSNALDAVVLDESQEHSWDTGRILDADVGPVFSTRPRRQLIYAGTASGPSWWHGKYLQAKAGAHLLVELGTWPDDADVEDPATWRAHHPGLRAGLTDEAFLSSQLRLLGPEVFAREYGNRWTDDQTGDAPIPLTAWQACTPAAGGRPVAVAFDVTPDRVWCSVVGVTDRRAVRLLHTGPAATLETALREHAAGLPIWAPPDQSGTVSGLREHGMPAQWLTLGDYRQACQLFHDAVIARDVHHDAQPQLLDALSWSGRSWSGDVWILSARASGGDVTAAKAAIVAWHGARHAAAPIA